MLAVGMLAVVAQAPTTGAGQRVHANLNQLMRGALYPAANVVFSAQVENPADVKPIPGQDPSMATDPLTSTFGGWLAVENAALTLAESANLLSIPGRTCSSGVPVPIADPAWGAFEGAVDADLPESQSSHPVTYVGHGGTETQRLLKELPCLRAPSCNLTYRLAGSIVRPICTPPPLERRRSSGPPPFISPRNESF